MSDDPSERSAATDPARQADPTETPFTPWNPDDLTRSVVTLPLLQAMESLGAATAAADAKRIGQVRALYRADWQGRLPVIIDVNLDHPCGRDRAKRQIARWISDDPPGEADELKSANSRQYLFARLSPDGVRRLVERDRTDARFADLTPMIWRLWLDHRVKAFINKSLPTVKADAARAAFGAAGQDIVWAVIDTGVDATHPHFATHATLDLPEGLAHRDFTESYGRRSQAKSAAAALRDPRGHGTHVAGIIAGEFKVEPPPGSTVRRSIAAEMKERDEFGNVTRVTKTDITIMAGVAPRAKIMSLKVLDEFGEGETSSLIAAFDYLQELNGNGRRVRVHGVNLSVGYGYDPGWFACGQSPVCVEADRLVRAGVVVVAAAGNDGFGHVSVKDEGVRPASLALTINDPGNAELAITVGATHRDSPHTYGVSYFSSKGPTGDGRPKPDLVAPGEKIVSCKSAQEDQLPGREATDAAVQPAFDDAAVGDLTTERGLVAKYKEFSGTSMAAPHVSGAAAAFLSVRREFIGRPERVKAVFIESATDLKRDRNFQGAGLLDLMRAVQSV